MNPQSRSLPNSAFERLCCWPSRLMPCNLSFSPYFSKELCHLSTMCSTSPSLPCWSTCWDGTGSFCRPLSANSCPERIWFRSGRLPSPTFIASGSRLWLPAKRDANSARHYRHRKLLLRYCSITRATDSSTPSRRSQNPLELFGIGQTPLAQAPGLQQLLRHKLLAPILLHPLAELWRTSILFGGEFQSFGKLFKLGRNWRVGAFALESLCPPRVASLFPHNTIRA